MQITKLHLKNTRLLNFFFFFLTLTLVCLIVIGHKKFVYDIWGNVVNLASRLEEASLPNKIHISEKMAFMLADEFIVEPIGTLELKGIGRVKTFFLLGKKET